MSLQHGASTIGTVNSEYLSANGRYDNDVSRVTQVKAGSTAIARYGYLGQGHLVGTRYPQPDLYSFLFDPADPDDYRDLDRFNRVIDSRWDREITSGPDVTFVHTSQTWDRNSNVTRIVDHVHEGFDVAYANDNLNRPTDAEEGTSSGSAITLPLYFFARL